MLHGDLEVAIVESVRDVPAERSELSSLLNQRMEKAQAKEQFSELSGFCAFIEELAVRDRVHQVGTNQIVRKSLGWLISHLNSVLQD